jgi:hypothetical protein
MLKFAELSAVQKSFCVRILDVCPQYRSKKDLTRKELLEGYSLLKEQRKQTGEKLGCGHRWMRKTNLVVRGAYQMPWPTEKELSEYALASVKTPKVKVVKAPKVKVVKAPKVKVAKVPKVKVPKVKKVAAPKVANPIKSGDSETRLQSIIDESVAHDADEEDFNKVLRDNGIEV